jgi:hypothetical protein
VRRLLLIAMLLVAPPAGAAGPALTFELVDDEPVSIRVGVKSPLKASPCTFASTIFEGLLEKNKPLTVNSDAYFLCVSQTRAPLTKTDFGPARLVVHIAGTAPTRMLVRSRPGPDGAPLVPKEWVAPLTITNIGTEKLSVRAAAGTTGPCDASVNTPLFKGTLSPGETRTILTDAPCVCFEQTYAPFLSSGWTPPTIRCRPSACLSKYCPMDMSRPFVLALLSSP